MSNQVKQYFLAPSWDYPPGGAIALGNIIASPARAVPAVATAASAATGQEEGLIASTKHGVEWEKGKTRAHKFGIWTKLLVASLGLPLFIPPPLFFPFFNLFSFFVFFFLWIFLNFFLCTRLVATQPHPENLQLDVPQNAILRIFLFFFLRA
jgi:hypothetical protein